jgi:hypothetical protein
VKKSIEIVKRNCKWFFAICLFENKRFWNRIFF